MCRVQNTILRQYETDRDGSRVYAQLQNSTVEHPTTMNQLRAHRWATSKWLFYLTNKKERTGRAYT